MKKLLVFFSLLCVGFGGNIHATNTDVSNIDNVIYITPFNASRGTEITLSIEMKNTAQIRGFQFDLYLPDGLTVKKSSTGIIQGKLSTGRLPEDDRHTLDFGEQSDGSIRFLCSSMYNQTFTGNDGEIATLTVNVSESMADGEYPITLKNMTLTETDISKFYQTDLVESTVTITAPSRTVLDETSTTAPGAASNVDVLVKRTIKANTWSTICLPFAMTAEQMTAAFGSDVELGDFVDYKVTGVDDVEGITVNFEDVDAIEANHPYIIKVGKNVTEFTVDDVDITPDEYPCVEYDNGKTGNRRKVLGTFMGTYVADFDFYNESKEQIDEPSGHPLFLNGGNFYYATANTMHMKAFRAYFDFADVLEGIDSSSSARAMISFGSNGTTRIEDADFLQVKSGRVYTISGQYLGERENMERLPKGIYIIDGKKEVVK